MIPAYQDVMLPLLTLLGDGAELSINAATEQLADHFELTDKERNQLLRSGKQSVFANRISWARTYLLQAGLIKSKRQGVVVITEQGKKVLEAQPTLINNDFLMRYKSFRDFRERKREVPDDEKLKADPDTNPDASQQVNEHDATHYDKLSIAPNELLEQSFEEVMSSLASELLECAIGLSPLAFERLLVSVLKAIGYAGNFKRLNVASQESENEGVDGVVSGDRLGLDTIYVRAKQLERDETLDKPAVLQFIGMLAKEGVKKGIYITTGKFTPAARAYTLRNEIKMALIDGEDLAEYMIEYNLGCTVQRTYTLKSIDNDYFMGE